MNRIVLCEITEKTGKQGVGERPWLTFVVADICDFQTDFFHYFAGDCLFKRLTDLGESGEKRVFLVGAPIVF